MPILSADTIAHKLGNSKVSHFIDAASQLLGKILTPNEVSSLLSFEDFLGLPFEVSLMAIEYTKSCGKKGFRDIEKTACKWHEIDINTIEKAEEFISKEIQKRNIENRFLKVIGQNSRALTEKEKTKIAQWTGEYNYSEKIIKEAYNRTVDSHGNYNMNYMAKILDTWHEQGFKTLDDINNEQKQEYKKSDKKKAKGGEPSFDVKKMMQESWQIVLEDS